MYKYIFFVSMLILLSPSNCLCVLKQKMGVHLYTTEHAIPYISSNAYRSICDHHHDRYSKVRPSKVKKGDLVFVKIVKPWSHLF